MNKPVVEQVFHRVAAEYPDVKGWLDRFEIVGGNDVIEKSERGYVGSSVAPVVTHPSADTGSGPAAPDSGACGAPHADSAAGGWKISRIAKTTPTTKITGADRPTRMRLLRRLTGAPSPRQLGQRPRLDHHRPRRGWSEHARRSVCDRQRRQGPLAVLLRGAALKRPVAA